MPTKVCLHEEVRLLCACELKFYMCLNISEAIEDTQTKFSKFYLTFIELPNDVNNVAISPF